MDTSVKPETRERKANPLYIKIPAAKSRHQGNAGKMWSIVRACNGSRRKMVDFICGIGGYYTNHGGPFAIEFNVATYGADVSVEHLWSKLVSEDMDVGPGDGMPAEHVAQAKALFSRVYAEHEQHVWEWGTEEAWEGWKDSDTPYETFTGERVDWKFGLYGRGGKHLCMEECEGEDMRLRHDDLEEWLMAKDDIDSGGDGSYLRDAEFIRKLFIICVQNSVELTTKNAAQEVEYRAAWRLWVSFCEDELADAISLYEGRKKLSGSAGTLLGYLSGKFVVPDGGISHDELEDFKAICQLADIQIEGE